MRNCLGDVVLDVKVGGVVHSSTQSCNTVVINFIILLWIIWFLWDIVIILWSYITIFFRQNEEIVHIFASMLLLYRIKRLARHDGRFCVM